MSRRASPAVRMIKRAASALGRRCPIFVTAWRHYRPKEAGRSGRLCPTPITISEENGAEFPPAGRGSTRDETFATILLSACLSALRIAAVRLGRFRQRRRHAAPTCDAVSAHHVAEVVVHQDETAEYRAVRTRAPVGETTRSRPMPRSDAITLAETWAKQGFKTAVEMRITHSNGTVVVKLGHRRSPYLL